MTLEAGLTTKILDAFFQIVDRSIMDRFGEESVAPRNVVCT